MSKFKLYNVNRNSKHHLQCDQITTKPLVNLSFPPKSNHKAIQNHKTNKDLAVIKKNA